MEKIKKLSLMMLNVCKLYDKEGLERREGHSREWAEYSSIMKYSIERKRINIIIKFRKPYEFLVFINDKKNDHYHQGTNAYSFFFNEDNKVDEKIIHDCEFLINNEHLNVDDMIKFCDKMMKNIWLYQSIHEK